MTTGLLVVDVQPAYRSHCDIIATQVAQQINYTSNPVNIMWVGEGLTADTMEDVWEYLSAHGARQFALERANFIEKDYGFFRSWMDLGVPKEDIIKVGSYMLKHGLYSSSDIDLMELYDGDVPEFPEWDHLCPPCFDHQRLLSLDALEICGGGADECLAEIELWLHMKGKPFTRLDALVY